MLKYLFHRPKFPTPPFSVQRLITHPTIEVARPTIEIAHWWAILPRLGNTVLDEHKSPQIPLLERFPVTFFMVWNSGFSFSKTDDYARLESSVT